MQCKQENTMSNKSDTQQIDKEKLLQALGDLAQNYIELHERVDRLETLHLKQLEQLPEKESPNFKIVYDL